MDAQRAAVLDARGAANAPSADTMRWVHKDADQRAVVLSHDRTTAGAIEGWLKSMGPGADPAIHGSLPPSQDAGDLLHTCLTMLGRTDSSAAPASSASSGAPAAAPAPIRFV
eukprot:7383948-Prymnesium_polylepis.1